MITIKPENNKLRGANFVLLAAISTLFSFCSQPRVLKEVFKKQTPHEAYISKLEKAGILKTEAGQKWVSVSQEVLQNAVAIKVPFKETGYFPAEKPTAVAYKFEAREGEKFNINLQYTNPPSFRLFGDVYQVQPQTGPYHVASLDTAAVRLEFEPAETGTYTLRLQPELLSSGNYTLSITKGGTMGFPVKGHTPKSIQSFFGDARDGGKRDHHGVDIFAKRGTPVVAAVDGVITDAGLNRLGGKVVWLWDMKKSRSLYYAHLDSQLVTAGTRVKTGDTLGLVGNTGNAKHTPPHLHFGIYSRGRGPKDPAPFLQQPDTILPKIKVAGSLLTNSVRLKKAPARGKNKITANENDFALGQVLGAQGNNYRILWPDGTQEYVAANKLEPATKPAYQSHLIAEANLTGRPGLQAPIIDTLQAKQQVQVIGKFGQFWFVEAGEKSGWIPATALRL